MTSGTVNVRDEMKALLESQAGGILATIRPDGNPHLVYMLCAVTDDLDVLLVTDPHHDHTRHMEDHPSVAFLVDTRERIREGAHAFHRLEVRGTAAWVAPGDSDYPDLHRILINRNPMMQGFLDRGCTMCRIRPSVMTLSWGGEKIEYRP